ncbi:MADCA protein, partial [Chauna torquata]|nr:MADCA protein [Chauna torquata]
MELAPLLLSLLWGCTGRPADKLMVVPQEPVVQYGGSVQLNCSLPCTGGTVQWRGLDTNLGSINSFPTHSILRISSAEVATAGTKICQGTCGEKRYQQTVNLMVYSLPDAPQLDADPPALVPGQPASLRCSAWNVYPLMGLVLTWYQGDRELQEDNFETMETDEELFNIVSTLQVAGKDVAEGVPFRCELTLSIGTETFTRMASMAVSTRAVMEQPVAVATSMMTTTGSPSTAGHVATMMLSPEPSVPTHDPTTALTAALQEPETTLEWAAETPLAERPAPRDPVVGSPSAHLATTVVPDSHTTSPTTGVLAKAQGTAVDGTSQGSHTTGMGTAPACSLRIWSLPPSGTRGRALRIKCCAQCAQNATVRWLRTPVALSQYQEEAVGSSSTLHLDRAEPRHQGHYQCVLLGRHSQVVSLQLLVLDDMLSPDPAIAMGTMISLLGLIVTGVISYCLWKRFRSQYDLS